MEVQARMLNGNQLYPAAGRGPFGMVLELLIVRGMILRSPTESLLIGEAKEARAAVQTCIHSKEVRPPHSLVTSKLLADSGAFIPLRFVVPFLNPLTASCV